MAQLALGKFIEKKLHEKGFERQALAEHLGVAPTNVWRWLTPHRNCPVSWKHYIGIAEFLAVPVATILREAEKDSPDQVREFHDVVNHIKRWLTRQQ